MVNKNVYLMLALFLGGLGAHKMYSGKWLLGLLYLVFSFTYIPVLLSLFDFIVALTKSADGHGNIHV